jgi:hypothetical protein
MAVAVVVLVVSLVKQPEQVRPVRALTVEQKAPRQRRSAARVVVVQARRVQLAMVERASAAQVLHISAPRMRVAAAVVVLLARVELAAAVLVVSALVGLERMELQTQAAAAAVQHRQLPEIVQAALAAAALLLCATAERQLDQLQEQQIPLHKQVATPSTPS